MVAKLVFNSLSHSSDGRLERSMLKNCDSEEELKDSRVDEATRYARYYIESIMVQLLFQRYDVTIVSSGDRSATLSICIIIR